MRKRFIGILIALVLISTLALGAIAVSADTTSALDHVLISPASTTLSTGGTQQFSAQGYDAANVAIAGLTYAWFAVNGGGSINSTGLFTAGNTIGTFTNTIEVIAVQSSLSKASFGTVAINASTGTLDHLIITPSTVNLTTGGIQQFSAQAYDSANAAITGLTYTWNVVNGGGTINSTGLFTAGSIAGNYTNTVQVIATQGSVTRAAAASVTISINITPVVPTISTDKLQSLVNAYVKFASFENLQGAQWTIKDASNTYIIKAIPGIINAVSGTSLTILPNGQATSVTYTINTGTVIVPTGSVLNVNDQVVVVTVNDTPSLIVKNTINSSNTSNSTSIRMPPGLAKKFNDSSSLERIPPGWAKGKKSGWDKEHFGSIDDD